MKILLSSFSFQIAANCLKMSIDQARQLMLACVDSTI
jgi:hypothetical protein